jgi:hypothetical protein
MVSAAIPDSTRRAGILPRCCFQQDLVTPLQDSPTRPLAVSSVLTADRVRIRKELEL